MWGEETHGFTGSLIQKAIVSKPFCCFDASLAEDLPICSSQHVANSLAESWSDNIVNPGLGLLIPAETYCSFTRQTWTDLTGTHSTRSNSFRSFWWLDTTYWQVTGWISSACAAPQPGHGCHEARVRAWGWQKTYSVFAGWSSSGVLTEQCRDLFLLMRGDGLLKSAALSPWMSPVCLASTLQHSGLTKATGDRSLPYSDCIWQPQAPHFCKHWGSKEISIAGTVCGCDYHGLQSNFCYCLPLQHNPNACGRGLIS